jgi:hypothetical protein
MNKSKLTVVFAFIVAAILAFSVSNKGVETAGAEPMNDTGRGPSAMGVKAGNSFKGVAVPNAGRVTATAVSVGASSSAGVNNAVAASPNSSTVVNPVANVGAAPEVVNQRAVVGGIGAGTTGFRGAPPPLVTPVPSGGGGGVPASRG